jgi:hypothetical protein
MAWDDRLKDFKTRRERARGMGGPERLAQRAAEGLDPADTRDVIARFLELSRTKRAVGRHRLAGWPAKF